MNWHTCLNRIWNVCECGNNKGAARNSRKLELGPQYPSYLHNSSHIGGLFYDHALSDQYHEYNDHMIYYPAFPSRRDDDIYTSW